MIILSILMIRPDSHPFLVMHLLVYSTQLIQVLLYGLLNQQLAYLHYTLKSIIIIPVGHIFSNMMMEFSKLLIQTNSLNSANGWKNTPLIYLKILLSNRDNQKLSSPFNIQLVMIWKSPLIMKENHLFLCGLNWMEI